mmetsp:Transcript_13527/g.44170  ORF Transcript_13527/g.44170 Transcript_13527/m.44170 type:complete len:251 (+) Transcript_13527:1390-2142(+)
MDARPRDPGGPSGPLGALPAPERHLVAEDHARHPDPLPRRPRRRHFPEDPARAAGDGDDHAHHHGGLHPQVCAHLQHANRLFAAPVRLPLGQDRRAGPLPGRLDQVFLLAPRAALHRLSSRACRQEHHLLRGHLLRPGRVAAAGEPRHHLAGKAAVAAHRLLSAGVGPADARGWRAADPHAHVGAQAATRTDTEECQGYPLLRRARRGGRVREGAARLRAHDPYPCRPPAARRGQPDRPDPDGHRPLPLL